MSDEKRNVFQRISDVMKEINYLKKDDQVKYNNTNYKALSEEKVTSIVRASLIKNGLVIVPVLQAHSREGNLSTVDTQYRIQNIDDPEDYIIAVSSGTGVDTQDKGVGKAMTYSYKYLLLRTFAIPSGEDTDKISSEELDDLEAKRKAEECAKNQFINEIQQSEILNEIHRTGWNISAMLEYIGKKFPSAVPKNIGEITEVEYGFIKNVLKKKPNAGES